ncbi:PREDICTED: crocetin glucosyltransferase, chloroplastic-like [Nelumbo nucifera]|uniref:Glycosyltransferase n=1 Tax=Nelumbo nucifera TaxID=4432 RepID=A0A1U7YYG5_NELNU|nr:PREDICTED: crocetin glucosyltransferase, chloroplastic-like [Nelumbo nucifera]
MSHPHFLLVTFPAQGHINPSLQFAKRLIRIGAQVTFATSVSAHRRMSNACNPDGLTFAPFSDGYDDGFKLTDSVEHFLSELKRRGSETLRELILSLAREGRPVSCLVHTLLLPWAADVARNLDVPWALLWIQPATVFDIYYYNFTGYGDLICNNKNDNSYTVELPGLPPLTSRDLPSFLLPSNTYAFALPIFHEQIETLERETKPRVLVNTFDALEPEALRVVEKIDLIGVGPLIPSAFLDGKDPSDKSFGGDLFHGSADYMEWLNSKADSSVVYVSFGSIALLPKRQMEELASALIESGRPFLWVIRKNENASEETKKEEEAFLSRIEEQKREGMIVPWCSQVEVLSHPSVGCFLSHCGWNSTLESLVTGVRVVAFPQWTDQATNAMLIEGVCGTGVRVRAKEGEGDGVVEREEIMRCLDMVMEGENGEEMKRNARKWKELAKKAVKEDGSSDKNLRRFVEEIRKDCWIV